MTTKEGPCSVKVIHGASDGLFDIAGVTVGELKLFLADAFNIPMEALAFVNGEQVEPSCTLLPNDTLEFVKQYGEKSILDPDEQAQLNRIEAMLNLLLVKPAEHGLPGRKAETREIATYINQCLQQHLTWKEVLKACRERWPNDDHVKNVDQIRATYRRFFRPSRKRTD